MWQEKSERMVRVAPGDLVYNVPAGCAGRRKKSKIIPAHVIVKKVILRKGTESVFPTR